MSDFDDWRDLEDNIKVTKGWSPKYRHKKLVEDSVVLLEKLETRWCKLNQGYGELLKENQALRATITACDCTKDK